MKNYKLVFSVSLLGLFFINIRCSKQVPVPNVKYASITVNEELDKVTDSINVKSDNPIVHIFLSDKSGHKWHPDSTDLSGSLFQKILFKTPVECKFIVSQNLMLWDGTGVNCLIDKDDCISDTGRFCQMSDYIKATSISLVDSKGVITTSNLHFK